GRPLGEFFNHPEWGMAVVFSPDSKHVLTQSGDGKMRIWEVATGRLVREWPLPEGPGFRDLPERMLRQRPDCGFSPDGKLVFLDLFGNIDYRDKRDPFSFFWNTASGQTILVPFGAKGWLFGPTGHHLLVDDPVGRTRLWDPLTGKVLRKLPPLIVPEG